MNNITYYESDIEGCRVYTKVPFEFLRKIKKLPINRAVLERLRKQADNFEKDTFSKMVFRVFNITKRIVLDYDYEKVVIEPDRYIGDGHTRIASAEAIEKGEIKKGFKPDKDCIVIEVDISDSNQLLEEYFSLDSSAATETSADKIRGALIALNVSLSSPIGRKGSFASALNFAYPGDVRDSALAKIAYFKKELELLDSCGVFEPNDSEIGKQHFYCSCLIAAKYYSGHSSEVQDRLKKFFKEASTLEVRQLNTSDDYWSGLTYLMYQASHPNKNCHIYDTEFHGATKGASWNPVVGWMLWCIDKYIKGQKIHFRNGPKAKSPAISERRVSHLQTLEVEFPPISQ